MVKYYIIVLLIFRSIVSSVSQTVDLNIIQHDSIDCLDEFKSLSVSIKGEQIVTYWTEAPVIKKESKRNLELICEQIDMSNYVHSDVYILLLINEEGIPYCCSIVKGGEFIKDKYKMQILNLCKLLRFTPAKSKYKNVKSSYTLVAKKSIKNNQWYFREYKILK